MEVNGPGPIQPAFPVQRTQSAASVPAPAATPPAFPQDEVEISSAGKMLDKLAQSSAVRAERLAQIQAAIADGTYETPQKLEAALERLLDEIRQDDDRR